MDVFNDDNKKKTIDLLSGAFDVYNTFLPGPEGEDLLLKLRDMVCTRMDEGEPLNTPVTIEVPLNMLGYMVASGKYLGDMCLKISKMKP